MESFSWIVGLLLGAAVLVGVAGRLRVPYPALLALAGAGVAFLAPNAPEIRSWGCAPTSGPFKRQKSQQATVRRSCA